MAPAAPDAPVSFEPIVIASHRALVGRQRELAARVAASPEIGSMLFINPVLALKSLGVKLSPEMTHHVLHTVQLPTELRQRLDELEAKLKEALGEAPRPTDAAWNPHFLFELRKLPPLDIGGRTPVYLPPLGEAEMAGLQARRPAAKLRYPQPRLLMPRNRVGSPPLPEQPRRIDLQAKAPELPVLEKPPASVTLENLWFYKDRDALVHDALELGILQRRALPIHTPDSFRKVQAGRKANVFHTWIKTVRFKVEGGR